MKKTEKSIVVGLATEAQMNHEFIDVWQRAQHGAIEAVEERLYFLEPATFFQTLSRRRLAVLQAIRAQERVTVQTLSRQLGRHPRHVARDVQILVQVGLIRQNVANELVVPWEKIRVEISLSQEKTRPFERV